MVAAGAPKAADVATPGCAPNNPDPVAGAMGFGPNRLPEGCDEKTTGCPNPVVVVAVACAPKEAPKAV